MSFDMPIFLLAEFDSVRSVFFDIESKIALNIDKKGYNYELEAVFYL